MATLVPQTVFTKTAKGILEVRNRSTRLPRELVVVLETVDGSVSAADLQQRAGLTDAQMHHALTTLTTDGYIKPVAPPTSGSARDPSAVQYDSPSEPSRLNMALAAHALASAEAAKVAQQEGRAALEARLRAEAEGRARALAETRLTSEAEARAAAEAAARAAQHARDRAEQHAAAATDAAVRSEAQAEARSAATAALRARAEAQARAEAEERARAIVEEKKGAEQRAREEAQAHGEAERRAQARAGAETRARDALQAQIDAAIAVRAHDDAAARARLHEAEAAAERAREDAQVLAETQGIADAPSTDDLHFDGLAQKLTARVNAERRAREEASRRTRGGGESGGATAGKTNNGFPPLEFVPTGMDAQPPAPAQDDTSAAALPDIDVRASAGRGDQKHVTPEHVPSALERAMMEREARAEAEARAQGGAAPAAAPPRAAAGAASGATTLSARSPQAAYEPVPDHPRAATAPAEAAPARGAKAAPTLDEDEPLHERLNVDRAAHDLIAESAESRRQAEAAALSRQALDMRRQRQEEEARRIAREEREEKRRKLARAVTLVAIGLPLLGVAWLQFAPLNGYVPEVQEALTARLNQPATVSTVRYVLLPTPRIVLEGLRIGAAHAVRIDRVDAHAWPGALLSSPMSFDVVDASGVTVDPGMMATMPSWTGGRSANAVHVSRLKLSGVKLASADANAEGSSGEVVFAANGTVTSASLSNEHAKLEVTPKAGALHVALNAREWRVPFGPSLTFSYLTVEGIADKDRFATTRLEGRVGGGDVTGTLAARWDAATTVGGELTIRGTRIDDAVRELAPEFRIKGVLSASLRYAMQADTATRLMERPMAEGRFTLTRGELGGVDLARAVQLPGTPTGGRTAFEELSGTFRIDGRRYGYRDLKLASGPLDATGSIDVAPGGRLSGRVDARMTAHSAVVARAAFAVRGTAADPQLSR